jgi:phage-related minor tail protein
MFRYGAEGGSVTAGMPMVVGERGRELFIPSSNGSIDT